MWGIFVILILILIIILIPSIPVLAVLVYLKYKHNVKTIIILLIIVTINVLFYGGIVISSHISEMERENEFDELFQLYDKDHPDYGLLRNYNTLTDDEKIIWDKYFGDGGRNIGRYMLLPIFYMFIIIFTIVTYFIIIRLLYKNNKKCYND